MGRDARVYLGSAELAAVCALLGRIPTQAEYLEIVTKKIEPFASELYRYLNFDQITGFVDEGRVVAPEDMPKIEEFITI
jgi:aconitate hydratase 2/2-methylisocitrate dehydratase